MESIVLGIAIVSAVGLGLWIKNREDFTIHNVDSPSTNSSIPPQSGLGEKTPENRPPLGVAMNISLQPNTVRWVMQGYNYQDTPTFFRDGKKISPIEYARKADALTYFFTLAAPEGVDNHEWILETYDFVKPVVIDQDDYKHMKVLPIRKRLGFNRWKLSRE